MKTKRVNELIFDRAVQVRDQWADQICYETALAELQKPGNERLVEATKRVQSAGIKNLGEKGSVELLTAVAIFLTQIPPKWVDELEKARTRRRDCRW